MSNDQIIADLKKAIETWDVKLVQSATQAAIDAGIAPKDAIEKGLGAGMSVIGTRFDAAEIFLPQVIGAAKTMEVALKMLTPIMAAGDSPLLGTVVFGTVEGDIHEIGKNVCCAMLRGAGFNVIDLGPDASAQEFIDAADENEAIILAGSALMTTTLESQRDIVNTVKEVEAPYKCIFGGAPCSQAWCDEIKADGYSATAGEVVELCKKLAKQ